ncbi:hypothetical protein [Litoreibacter roseus]|uniref:Glycosyl transferase family 2 n=1 Tax=Litoreibacter roseus TaxID=2601869 RepID=A0A6N6JAQ5_9RHOB|nr:hypothetical protein [Litoreibacter roseus]GFE63077.1 hypothetical protein KIN_01510 [Litoreibacter roseus]
MHHPSLQAFLADARTHLSPSGPYAMVFVEDTAEVRSTVTHCQKLGFSDVIVCGLPDLLPAMDDGSVHLVSHSATNAVEAINGMISVAPDVWLHYCYNAEYLFYPFCETRSVSELVAFHGEERRRGMLTCVLDLYSSDLGAHPNGVTVDGAHFDRAGYYALARRDDTGGTCERQYDFYGGLRWRFEDHIPADKRRIDRIGLFRAEEGLKISSDHRFNIDEYNTYACKWHHNITGSIASFRTAKALLTNPGSMYSIPHFWWDNSTKFEWSSLQLLELGFIEPGQWF